MVIVVRKSLILPLSLLASCGGGSGEMSSTVPVVSAPTPTPSTGRTGAMPAPAPTPTPSSYYARFADASASQSFDLACLTNRGFGEEFDEAAQGLRYDRVNGDASYVLRLFGSRSFTAADRVVLTDNEIRYRQQNADGRQVLAIFTGSGTANPQYTRAANFVRYPAAGGIQSTRCVTGTSTLTADVPRSALTMSLISVDGGATMADGSYYSLSSPSGSVIVDPVTGTIQANFSLFGRKDATGTAIELGQFNFRTVYDGSGSGFFGVIDDGRGTSGPVGAGLFGPAAKEVGITFFLTRTGSDGRRALFYGQLIGAR